MTSFEPIKKVYLSPWSLDFGPRVTRWPEYAPPECMMCGETATQEWYNAALTCDRAECTDRVVDALRRAITCIDLGEEGDD